MLDDDFPAPFGTPGSGWPPDEPSVDDTPEPWSDDAIPRAVGSAARIAGRRFSGFASRDDLSQEAWLWICTHETKMLEWQSLGEPGRRKLVRALINTCTAFGQKEKAEKSGYKAGDNYYYGLGWLKEFLPTVFAKGMNLDADTYADFSDRSMWLDVTRAIGSLSESEYEILRRAFQDDPAEEEGYNNVADFLGLSYDAARQRVNRVLRKIQNYLGGENPHPRRKMRSNAQALAETRNQYEA